MNNPISAESDESPRFAHGHAKPDVYTSVWHGAHILK